MTLRIVRGGGGPMTFSVCEKEKEGERKGIFLEGNYT